LESSIKHKQALAIWLTFGLLAAIWPAASAQGPVVSTAPQKLGSALIQESEYLPLSKASGYLEQGDNATALSYLVETNERNPVNILGLFHLGCAYLELAKQSTLRTQQNVYLDQAQQAFERVVDLNDELTLTYFKLGKIALMRNDIEAAKHYYRQGLAIEPDNAALIFNLARVYDQNNERDEAIRYYQQTIATDPNFTYAYNNLALMYEDAKDYSDAEKAYKQALKKDKTYNLARLNLGNLYASNGKYEAAKKVFAEAQALEPQNEWVYYYEGNMYLRMNRFNEAITSYNQALSLNPKHATTYYLLAVSLSKLNRMDEALQASLHYVQLAPDGEYAKEMQSLIMAVKLSQSNGLMLTPAPGPTAATPAKN
jgi:tetratricopeptide (TPR) repeat protein